MPPSSTYCNCEPAILRWAICLLAALCLSPLTEAGENINRVELNNDQLADKLQALQKVISIPSKTPPIGPEWGSGDDGRTTDSDDEDLIGSGDGGSGDGDSNWSPTRPPVVPGKSGSPTNYDIKDKVQPLWPDKDVSVSKNEDFRTSENHPDDHKESPKAKAAQGQPAAHCVTVALLLLYSCLLWHRP